MEEQEVVNQPQAESNASVDSTPTESSVEQTTDTQQSPADASVEPEKKVSDMVPRSRINDYAAKVRELEAELARRSTATAPSYEDSGNASFDPETQRALSDFYERQREKERTEEFIRKHREDLADPIVAALVKDVIGSENEQGRYIPHEEALKRAKDIIAERTKPQVEQAREEATKEGEELAVKKQQASAVGDVSSKEVRSDDELTAEEYATKYNLPRG